MPYIIIAIIIILALGFFKTATGKGILGELDVRMVLGSNKEHLNHFVINNLTFHDGKKSVQIDHIVINPKGIFVIETKNYAGRIYGKEHDDNWTQVLAYGKVKNSFYSPIKQNLGHIYSLKQVLGNVYPFYSYVVFTKKADLQITSFETTVIPSYILKRTIKKQSSIQTLSSQEVKQIYDRLLELKKTNTITKKEHVKSINERIKNRETK